MELFIFAPYMVKIKVVNKGRQLLPRYATAQSAGCLLYTSDAADE